MAGIFPVQEFYLQPGTEKKMEQTQVEKTEFFRLVPHIALHNGTVVDFGAHLFLSPQLARLKKFGRYGEMKKLDELFEKLGSKYQAIMVSDLDGIFYNKPQLHLLSEFAAELEPELWVDIGIREAECVVDVFVAGADMVVLNSMTVNGLEEVKKATEFSPNLIFNLFYHRNRVCARSTKINNQNIVNVICALRKHDLNTYILTGTERTEIPSSLSPADMQQCYIHVEEREKLSHLRVSGWRGAIIPFVWGVDIGSR